METVKIAIVLEGGLVSAVLSAGVPVEFALVDYDTDGAEPAALFDVPQDTGRKAQALGYIGEAERNGPRVLELLEIIGAHEAGAEGTGAEPAALDPLHGFKPLTPAEFEGMESPRQIVTMQRTYARAGVAFLMKLRADATNGGRAILYRESGVSWEELVQLPKPARAFESVSNYLPEHRRGEIRAAFEETEAELLRRAADILEL